MYPLIVRLNNSDNIKEKLKQLSRDNFYTSEEPVVKIDTTIDTTIGDKILNLISIVCCLVTIISSIIINVLVFAKNKEK